jgi:rhomboid family GlyGly-CTERM serine protease
MTRRCCITPTVGVLALVVWFAPGLAERLVYDRSAIPAGEVWRLVTGHLVHFSADHLWLDVAAFLIAGWAMETRMAAPRWPMFGAAPLFISLTLLGMEPGMARYGGLSGWATALLAFAALDFVRRADSARVLGWLMLIGLVAKLAVEMSSQAPVFVAFGQESIYVATGAHVSGLLLAVAAQRFFRTTRIRPESGEVAKSSGRGFSRRRGRHAACRP